MKGDATGEMKLYMCWGVTLPSITESRKMGSVFLVFIWLHKGLDFHVFLMNSC